MNRWPVISCEYAADRGAVETCAVEIPVGTSSADGIVVFGKDGYLFVYSGANDICSQYLMSDEDAGVIAARWNAVIQARRELARARNFRFLQMIIPEKSSLLPDKVPFQAFAGTPIQRAVTAAQDPWADYLDVRDLFDGQEALSAFPKANGHLSPLGTTRVFQAALEQVGFEPPAVAFGPPVLTRSDLGDHFGGMTFYNHVSHPISPEIETYRSGLHLTEVVSPEGHQGQRRAWNNPTAPIKKRVLAFANSFFERGDSAAHLSWWFATWFEEFKFIWSSELDPAEVEAYRPDIVICQTIERFLISAPVR